IPPTICRMSAVAGTYPTNRRTAISVDRGAIPSIILSKMPVPTLDYGIQERKSWWRWSAQLKTIRIAGLVVALAVFLEVAGIGLAIYSESLKEGPYVPAICYKYDYVITSTLLIAPAANVVSAIFSALAIRSTKRVSGFNFIVLIANCLSLSWNI